jgi:DNA repair exonuclease SbcCD ATPase subunit
MRTSRLLVLPLFIGFLGLLPATASAQLKDAQDKGWSVLKEGYALVASMQSNKSNRTRANFDAALAKILTSMADMKPYIEKMGAQVDDQDKSYASGCRNEILKTWSGVSDAHQRLKNAYEAARESPEKLAEISDELDKLKAALEQYETTFKASYQNYRAKWDEINNATTKMNADFKTFKDKFKALEDQEMSLLRRADELKAEETRIREEKVKLHELADQLAVADKALAERFANVDRDSDQWQRFVEETKKLSPIRERLFDGRLSNLARNSQILGKQEENARELDKVTDAMDAALPELEKYYPLKMIQRFKKWNDEFPASTYSFQSLK